MTIHCKVLCPMWRSRWIEGRATLPIAMSSTTMNCATHDRKRMIPLLVFALVVIMGPFRSRLVRAGWRAGPLSRLDASVGQPLVARLEGFLDRRGLGHSC